MTAVVRLALSNAPNTHSLIFARTSASVFSAAFEGSALMPSPTVGSDGVAVGGAMVARAGAAACAGADADADAACAGVAPCPAPGAASPLPCSRAAPSDTDGSSNKPSDESTESLSPPPDCPRARKPARSMGSSLLDSLEKARTRLRRARRSPGLSLSELSRQKS